MKKRIETVEDDFWTERLLFFTAQLPTYYRKPQPVHGRFHTSDEEYSPSRHEIIPLSERRGQRTVSDHRGSNSQVVDFERVEIYPVFTAKIENPEKSST